MAIFKGERYTKAQNVLAGTNTCSNSIRPAKHGWYCFKNACDLWPLSISIFFETNFRNVYNFVPCEGIFHIHFHRIWRKNRSIQSVMWIVDVTNIIGSLLFGERYDYDDKEFHDLRLCLDRVMEDLETLRPVSIHAWTYQIWCVIWLYGSVCKLFFFF